MFVLYHRPDRVDILKALIASGADVNAKFGYEAPLSDAATQGDAASTAVLVAAGADLNARDSSGETALDQAAYFQHEDVARLLITSGIKENLMDAALLGDAAVATDLLRQDPALMDVRAQTPRITPFEAALLRKAKTGDDAVLSVMLAHKPKLSLFEAAALGRTDLVKVIVVNAPYRVLEHDGGGKTALDWALRLHQHETAAYLLDQGSVPTVPELETAIFDSDADSVQLLVDHRVDKDDLIPGMGSPYQIALRRGETRIAEILK